MARYYNATKASNRKNEKKGLRMNADDYLQERIDNQIKWLSSASGRNQQWFKILRLRKLSWAAPLPIW